MGIWLLAFEENCLLGCDTVSCVRNLPTYCTTYFPEFQDRFYHEQISSINNSLELYSGKVNSKAIPVIGHGSPYVYEILRLPHFLDNRLTDGVKGVSLTRRPPFTPRNIVGTHFC
jgi:hypothetical protein